MKWYEVHEVKEESEYTQYTRLEKNNGVAESSNCQPQLSMTFNQEW